MNPLQNRTQSKWCSPVVLRPLECKRHCGVCGFGQLVGAVGADGGRGMGEVVKPHQHGAVDGKGQQAGDGQTAEAQALCGAVGHGVLQFVSPLWLDG